MHFIGSANLNFETGAICFFVRSTEPRKNGQPTPGNRTDLENATDSDPLIVSFVHEYVHYLQLLSSPVLLDRFVKWVDGECGTDEQVNFDTLQPCMREQYFTATPLGDATHLVRSVEFQLQSSAPEHWKAAFRTPRFERSSVELDSKWVPIVRHIFSEGMARLSTKHFGINYPQSPAEQRQYSAVRRILERLGIISSLSTLGADAAAAICQLGLLVESPVPLINWLNGQQTSLAKVDGFGLSNAVRSSVQFAPIERPLKALESVVDKKYSHLMSSFKRFRNCCQSLNSDMQSDPMYLFNRIDRWDSVKALIQSFG